MAETIRTVLETKRFSVVLRSYHTPDGRQHTRETIQHPGAVTVIPMVDDDHVCLVRNYRVAVDQTLIELPAGTLEPGEDPAITAVRELAEETGYRAGQLKLLCDFAISPGILNEQMYLYVATELEPGETSLDQGEIIDTLVVSWSEAMRMVDAREINDAKTLVGLMAYDRLRAAS